MQTKTTIAHDSERGLWRVEVFAGMHCMASIVAHNPEQLKRIAADAQRLEAQIADLSEADLQAVIANYHGQQN